MRSATDTFEVDLEARADEVWVLPRGELDIDTVEEMEHSLSIALASEAERVVIDLRSLDFLDSAGLRAVVGPCLGPDRARVELVPGSPTIQGIFNISGLTGELRWRPDDAR